MNSFLGNDPLDPPLSSELLHGASLDEIRAFFPSDAPAPAEAPAAEVDFDDDEFDDLEWPQLHEFDDDMVLPRPRDEIEESPPPPYTERPSQPPAYATAALPRVEEITEASPQAEEAAEHQFPVPPPSALYDSFDELLAFLQTFHRDNGAAIRTGRSLFSMQFELR
ncbi:transposase [Trichoderma arundinaceum]|uniref:Transposase n=1 Tax=Trichoderma arundinaceum TaxID=490622 RepID=A0A395N6S8_TRIAR|nr:transposase [Trichoderma arundinaceum]